MVECGTISCLGFGDAIVLVHMVVAVGFRGVWLFLLRVCVVTCGGTCMFEFVLLTLHDGGQL